MKLLDRIKKAYQNYVIRMEKANKEAFGGERPDCCKLNRNQANEHR